MPLQRVIALGLIAMIAGSLFPAAFYYQSFPLAGRGIILIVAILILLSEGQDIQID